MSILSKFKNAISPDPDEYEYEDDYDYEDNGYDNAAPQQAQPQNQQYAQPTQNRVNNSAPGVGGFSSSSLELKVVKPDTYDNETAQKIADHLLNKRSVVLNLESTNKDSARRLIDFLSGVAYSIGGYIQRVATNTFIVVPENVGISSDKVQEVKKQEEDNLY